MAKLANPGGVNLETGKNRGERGWGGWRGEREDERAMPPPLREGCAPRALTGGGARGEGEALRLKRVGAGVAAERPPRARALAPVGEEVEGESTAGQEAGEWRSRTSLKTCRNGVGIRIPPPPPTAKDGGTEGPPGPSPTFFAAEEDGRPAVRYLRQKRRGEKGELPTTQQT